MNVDQKMESREVSGHQTRIVRTDKTLSLREACGRAARSDHSQADENQKNASSRVEEKD
jgi:hypothetical protein